MEDMIEITTNLHLHETLNTYVYVVLYAYVPQIETCNILLPILKSLSVMTPGVVFIKADFSLSTLQTLKRSLGITRFPTMLYATHGDIKELTIGHDVQSTLETIVKWYKTVYTLPRGTSID